MAAVLWVEHGHVDQSLKRTAKAAKLDPKRSLHPWHSGYAYLALGDVDMALAYFELAQQLRPVDQQTSFQRAFTLLLAGHTEEAVGIFETLLTEGSDAEVSWSLKVLAGLDVHAGHTEAALTRYRQYQPECCRKQARRNGQSKSPQFLRSCSIGLSRQWPGLEKAMKAVGSMRLGITQR